MYLTKNTIKKQDENTKINFEKLIGHAELIHDHRSLQKSRLILIYAKLVCSTFSCTTLYIIGKEKSTC